MNNYKPKVYRNLNDSDIVVNISGYEFYFSSNLYKEKFLVQLDDYVDYINESLSNRFKLKIDASILGPIALYRKIEKRGFRVIHDGSDLECLIL